MRKALRKKAAPKRVAKKTRAPRKGGTRAWTAEEIKMLRATFKQTVTREIAKKLKRTLSSVRSKAVALSLRKSPAKKAAPKAKVVKKGPKRRVVAKRGRRC